MEDYQRETELFNISEDLAPGDLTPLQGRLDAYLVTRLYDTEQCMRNLTHLLNEGLTHTLKLNQMTQNSA